MSSSATRKTLFERPGDYDRLRSGFGFESPLVQMIVREGDLLGRRVLDIGCGTGSFAAVLEDRARVWGVDASAEMLAAARETAPRSAFKLARAEELPFKDAWFDRAVMNSVVHHLDTSRAFPEARRVLVDGGRLVIRTVSSEFFSHYWLFAYFPTMERVDRARFATPEQLEQRLRDAGFASTRVAVYDRPVSLDRDAALERIRGRHISTFDHVPDDEYAEGLARALRELPDIVEYRHVFPIVVAER
jgi:ubiquinone/menaquinone biosynthesis C-methylase UbiE